MDRSAITVGPGMDMPIMHDSDRYELVRDIGSGNFGVARLMRDKHSNELVAVKYIERGEKVSHLIYCVCISVFISTKFEPFLGFFEVHLSLIIGFLFGFSFSVCWYVEFELRISSLIHPVLKGLSSNSL